MNANKLFLKLKERGITDAEYRYSTTTSFSCGVFRGELANYSANTSSLIIIDAVINNKLAMITTEDTSNNHIDSIIDNLLKIGKYTTKEGAFIYKEKAKYRRYKYFNDDLINIPTKKKIDITFELEKKLKAIDSRIIEVETGYSENTINVLYQNTAGIKLRTKKNFYNFAASVVIKDGEDKKTEFLSYEDNDFNKFNVDNFVKELHEKAIKKLNGVNIPTNKYKTVFDPEVVDTLLHCYVSQLNAELVMKNSSWFKDKLNTQVANKRVTILSTPLKRTHEFTGFDVQGVPTKNRTLIKKGMLLEYLHNLETAKHFNVAPTGDASLSGSKITIAPTAIHLKPGRLTKEELLAKVGNGVYITSLEGLHAGMNEQSGDFSLKAEGFVIKDGKLDKFINMMTVASNLFEIFNNIKALSENIEYQKSGNSAPCIYLDKIALSV